MQKRDFETYQKCFRDFEILLKFSETHVFQGTIHHPLKKLCCSLCKTIRWTLIADDNHMAGYQSNLQFIDS